MALVYNYLFPVMWLSFLAYWWAISRNVRETGRRESMLSRLVRLVLIVCAVALLWLPSVPLPLFGKRFLPSGTWCFWSGAAITAGGLLFAVWARRHLGKNWSQAVTLKELRRLREVTNPYSPRLTTDFAAGRIGTVAG